MGRIIALCDNDAWCTFPSLGPGAAFRIPLELFEHKASKGFRFFAKVEQMDWPSTAMWDIYEHFGISNFELDHKQLQLQETKENNEQP